MTLVEAMAAVHASPHQAPAAWRVIQRAAESHARGPDREDVAQWAVIAVLRTVERGVRIESPHAWLRLVAERRRIDAWHAWHQHHVCDERIDAVPDTRGTSIGAGTRRVANDLAQMVAAIEAEIDRDEVTSCGRRFARLAERLQRMTARRRLQMRATLLRALGRSYAEIRSDLGLDVSDDVLAKDIERGRAPLLDVLARAPVPASVVEARDALRLMVAKKRYRPRARPEPRPTELRPCGLMHQIGRAFASAA